MMGLYQEAESFLIELHKGLHALKLDLSAYELDHLCFRVNTIEEYRSYKAQLCLNNELLHEAMIGGRPICSFRLKVPLRGAGREVWILELPAPKKNRIFTTGFEHAEFVVPDELNAFADRHLGLALDRNGLAKAHNPELELALAPGMAVKFHRHSLESLALQERK